MDCAAYLLNQKRVIGMSITEVAQELYAHAVGYYYAETLKGSNRISASVKNYLLEKGGRIDIEDYGDTTRRKLEFAAVWNFVEIK